MDINAESLSRRFACALAVRFWPKSELAAPRLTGTVRNVSRGGIAFSSHRLYPRGTLLAIVIRSAEGDRAAALVGAVVHATPRTEGGWLIGCKLTRELDVRELASVIACG